MSERDDLHILLLGPPTLFCGGKPFSLSRRGLRSILYYLACQTRPVARAELMTLFWGNEPEKTARQNLRVALSRLKAELPDPAMLVTIQEQVSLDQDDYYCDVHGFEIACTETARICAQVPAGVPLPEAVRQRMVAALDLWRGPRLLTGVDLGASAELDDWLAETGEHLQNCRQRMLERLSQHAEACQDLESALEWLRQALALDPTNDLLNLEVGALLERHGRIAEALAHLQQTHSIYARDGSEELPAMLEDMADRLQNQVKMAAAKRDESIRPEVLKSSLQLPLIGRKEALEVLRKAYLRKAPMLVTGEAGAGKSRLVREFYSSLFPAPQLLYASARALTLQPAGQIPFLPLVEILRAALSAEEWRAVPPVWAAMMTLLLPEIEMFVPGIKTDADGGFGQTGIFEALRQTLLGLAARRPLLMVIDDAHLCDESSFLALNYLLRHGFFGDRARLVLCARMEDQFPAYRQFFRILEQDYDLETIELGLFNPADVAEILRLVFGSEGSPELIEQLRRDSGGNPLYLLELLRARLDISDSLNDAVGRFPLAGSLHALARQRLQNLSPEAVHLLTVAAVCGKSVPLWLLEKSSRLSLEMIAEGLDELQRAHLLLLDENPNHEQCYSFVHEMLREVLLLQLTPARKRLVYVRVAEAICAHPSSTSEARAAAVAHLYEQAGDEQTAFGYWLTAAGYASRMVSYHDALAACRRAEKLLNRLEDRVDAPNVLQLYSTWIDLGYHLTHAVEIRYAAERLLAQGRHKQNRALVARGYLGFAVAAELCDNAAAGLEMLEQARSFMDPVCDPNRQDWILFHRLWGACLLLQDHNAAAVTRFQQAMDLTNPTLVSENTRMIEDRARCGFNLANALLYHGELEKAVAVVEAALDDSRTVMNHAIAAHAYLVLCTANYYLARYALAKEQGQICWAMLRPMKSIRATLTLRASLGRVALATGEVDQAWLHAEAALQGAQPGGFNRVATQALRLQGDVLCVFKDYCAALAYYQKSVELEPDNFFTYEAQVRLGMMLILTGKVQEGLDLFAHLRQTCRLDEMKLLHVQLDCGQITVYFLQGQLSQAYALAEEVSARAEAAGLLEAYLAAEGLAVRVLLQQGQLGQAVQRGLAAAARAKVLNDVFSELNLLSLVLEASGGEDASQQVREQARVRMRGLIARLDSSTQLDHLRPVFNRFATNLTGL